MKKQKYLYVLFIFLSSLLFAQNVNDIDIKYEKFVLDNGLTLIVHEDHKAPIVAVNVWYHVGSKNEKMGKTGFAHLFEHLMFNGSENFDDDYFQALERVGATDLNGTTSNDRTNYFQNVPTSAVELALWMESDRMGHLLGAVTQEKLDEQRGVVQNEKRQGENQPYALAYETITENTYPKGHPYSWTVIGSMEDLDAASLEDVHEWFKTYYGPANAVLVVAGDITAQDAKEKVEKYFGDIPSGPPIKKHDVWVAKMEGTKRQIAEDRVPQSRIYKTWNIPEWKNEELAYLDLASDVLAAGKISRLYKRLVYEDQIATDVSAYYSPGEIGSQFQITATAKPGVELSIVETAIDEELAKFLAEGPTQKELNRVKTQHIANFIRGIERIGGFGGKSDILAQCEVYGGSPDYYKKKLQWVSNSTVSDIQNAAVKWLSDGVNILEIHPFPQYTEKPVGADRSKLPETGTPPVAKFPELQEATLSNGLKIMLAQTSAIPVVNFRMMVDAGYASDQFGLPGTASLALSMMDEGTKNRNSLQISEELAMLGASINTGSNLDMSTISMSSLKSNLDKSLDLYADVLLNPSFPENELERLKKQAIAGIQREKSTPVQMALRVFPQYIYGKDHAYGLPFTGSGYEESVSKITKDDLVKFHQTWIRPNNSTLVVVGDISLNDIKAKLEDLFSDWESKDVPQKNISEVNLKEKSTVYLMDKPGAQQSIILAGHAAPPKADKDDIALEAMNTILGGSFTSRINMNLREDKHWSYGSRTMLLGARGQRPFLVYALVQTDKTKESVQEVIKELSGIISDKPATEDELNKIKLNETLSLPGSWETGNEIAGSLADMVRYGYPKDYYDTYASKITGLSLEDIDKAAKKVVNPSKIDWVVVGDKAVVEKSLNELGMDVKLIDVDGNVIEKDLKTPEKTETSAISQ
ncbi:MAG: insulinase family protein [Ignavibacteriales bacterium]|nr:insulinase family protein [Ignavibacteriales bacterium]